MLPPIVLTHSTRDRLALLISLMRERDDDDLLEFIDQELARADVVSDHELNTKVANLGSKIVYRDNISGQSTRATLIHPAFEDSVADGLSVLTPAGACILGLSEGGSMQYWAAKGLVCDVTLCSVLGCSNL